MPLIPAMHPQVVHFAIALLLVGVLLRLVSFTGRVRFSNHAAVFLLVLGTVAAAVAVKSGVDAHGPVERIPGVRALVIEHEDLGILTRNIFFGVVVLELLALGFATRTATAGYAKIALALSALAGVAGSFYLYEAAEHGGELVYSYAGGPGLRTGDPADVERLLTAGLYSQAMADRNAGDAQGAARLIAELAARTPADTTVQLMHVESLLLDAKDYPAALTAVRAVSVDPTVARFATRKATLAADIFIAMGARDSARAVLEPVVAAFPTNARLKAKLDSLAP